MLTAAQKKRRDAVLAADDGKGRFRRVTYELVHVVCGKPLCWCGRRKRGAPRGHGPYWYAYWRDGQRTRSLYVGKTLHRIVVSR